MTREEAVERLADYFEYEDGLSADKDTQKAYKMARKALENAPKHGRWIIHEPFSGGRKNCNECIECSVCHTLFGHEHYAKTPHCPICGARMDGGEDE